MSAPEIFNRIALDLGFRGKPRSTPERIFKDQLKYGALSEWIRAITQDVDPLIGSNRIGVTKAYLEERAADVLMDISMTIDGHLPVTKERAQSLSQWMVNKMLLIGELWEPFPGNILCMHNQTVSYLNGHARVTGLRQKDGPSLRQVGLCHYEEGITDMDVVSAFETAQMEAAKLLTQRCPELKERTARTVRGCFVELNKLKRAVSISHNQDYTNISLNTTLETLPEYLQIFILTSAWPTGNMALNWDECRNWAIPIF